MHARHAAHAHMRASLTRSPQVGCRKYQDEEWLRVVRRWPPAMVDRMRDFLRLAQREAAPAPAL